MPRTKKQISENNSTEVEKSSQEEVVPFNQTIQAPMIDSSLVELQIAGYTILPPDNKIKLDDCDLKVEKPVVEEQLAEAPVIIEENSSEQRLFFHVYESGVHVDSCPDGSDELENYLIKNEEQINSWIEELSRPTDNQEDLALFNTPDNGIIYKSLAQYYAQNGFAPQPPKIVDWMTYYMKKHYPITPQEIAVLVKGDLNYSFVPYFS